jgi:hypothetical protein
MEAKLDSIHHLAHEMHTQPSDLQLAAFVADMGLWNCGGVERLAVVYESDDKEVLIAVMEGTVGDLDPSFAFVTAGVFNDVGAGLVDG